MQYCSLQHWTLLLSPSPIRNWVFVLLWLHPFILSRVISPLISSSRSGTTDLGNSSFRVLSFWLSYCSWGSQGKNTEVVCHSVLQWTTFCQTSPPRPICLGWPYTAWLNFIELDKAVVHVMRLGSFLWLLFQSVCFLMLSLNAYCHTWVSHILGCEISFHGCSNKVQPLLLTLEVGITSQPQLLTLDVGYLLLASAQTTAQLQSSHMLVK